MKNTICQFLSLSKYCIALSVILRFVEGLVEGNTENWTLKNMNLKLTICYDGTNFQGWQSQTNGKAVQDVLSSAIEKITQVKSTLYGSGRTDSGVHARGQVASFHYAGNLALPDLQKGLNAVLPPDIVIIRLEEVPEKFHGQFDVVRKCYSYTIYTGLVPSVFDRDFCVQVMVGIDIDVVNWCLTELEGTHDFAGFAAKGVTKTTIRTIVIAKLIKLGNDKFSFEFIGNGFLYRQVRIMAGSILQVSRNNISKEDFLKCLHNADPKLQGAAAPAKGLCLEWVEY